MTRMNSQICVILVLALASLQCCLSSRAALHSSSTPQIRHARDLLAITSVQPMRFNPMPEGLQVASCAYQPITGTCKATHNYLLGAAFNLTGVPFGGRAAAFIVAANAYCGQFNRTSPNCSYPCQNNGENCVLSGAFNYGIYSCPNTQAQQDVFCMTAPAANRSLCNTTSECQEIPSANGKGPATCMANFKAKLNSGQYRQYLADFGTVRRNVWGCCSASNAKWMNDVYCSRFSSYKDQCSSQAECSFNDMTGDCTWSMDSWLTYNFGRNPISGILKFLSMQCSKFTTPQSCNSYRPVTVYPRAVSSILGFDLSSINQPVDESSCAVWNQDNSE